MVVAKSAIKHVGPSSCVHSSSGGSYERKRERPNSVRFSGCDEIYLLHDVKGEIRARDEKALRPADQITSVSSGAESSAMPTSSTAHSTMFRFGLVLVLLSGLLALLRSASLFADAATLPLRDASGGPIGEDVRARDVSLEKREDSATHWCFKWAQQSAIVNGTLYLYGGQLTTDSSQTSNEWTNDFVTLDLTKTWQAGQPPFKGLPQPSGPPAVALGYLWNSLDSLFLYGGEFEKNPGSPYPAVTIPPFSTWEYDIASSSWIEHSNPVTSQGTSAPDAGVSVERAAEGAGVNVPSLGRGFYFGGHLDTFTTPGWDLSIPRQYLQSLLEFTFPGRTNPQVDSLQNGQTAGKDGVYRNVTTGGLQSQAGFTQRADGLLIYIPGFGNDGILLALAGGTNDSFTQMNEINVYDISTSSWYTQATTGSTPKYRVNPCAVVAAAADGSSYNVYMFGGQELLPYGSQKQYHDMWILTLPSFTWIEVDQSNQPVPPGRSGHTCNIWDAQMVMVGGYLGDSELTCEYPGTFVFDLSGLKWQQQFTSLGANANGLGPTNPLDQQANQRVSGNSTGGLEGSYGYTVPKPVISVIGGNAYGGATITQPIATASSGPLATARPQTYTLTQPNGQTVTETSIPNSVSSSTSSSSASGPNIAAIVVGTLCGLLALLIIYLLFCLLIYKKQLQLYKHHVEMSQAHARGEKPPVIPGLWATKTATTTTGTTSSSSGREKATNEEEARTFLGPVESGGSQGGAPGSSTAYGGAGALAGAASSARRSSRSSSTEDLMAGQEPTFVGVMLNPRRSLRVINRD